MIHIMSKTKRSTDEDKFIKKSKKAKGNQKPKREKNIKDQLRHISSIDDWSDPDEDE